MICLCPLVFVAPTLNPSGLVNVTEGDNVSLSCDDPGNSNRPTYQWFNSTGAALSPDNVTTPPIVYTITSIRREAAGDYSCVLRDPAIPNVTPTSTVTVNVRHKIACFVMMMISSLFNKPVISGTVVVMVVVIIILGRRNHVQ